MDFQNSRDIIASYSDSSYSSVSYTTINNYIADSFNSNHTGHNAGGACGLVFVVVLILVFAAFVIGGMMVLEVLV